MHEIEKILVRRGVRAWGAPLDPPLVLWYKKFGDSEKYPSVQFAFL